jgi:hypothetical protein
MRQYSTLGASGYRLKWPNATYAGNSAQLFANETNGRQFQLAAWNSVSFTRCLSCNRGRNADWVQKKPGYRRIDRTAAGDGKTGRNIHEQPSRAAFGLPGIWLNRRTVGTRVASRTQSSSFVESQRTCRRQTSCRRRLLYLSRNGLGRSSDRIAQSFSVLRQQVRR